ncbi:BrnT family toxin [Sphingomonas sp. DC1100-1]|uniref:BrnT family toxin n=1 Tax=unclassified Sphingomonas TaxID=196159 RepID=UPI003CF01170
MKLHKGGGCGDSFDPKKRDKVLRERGLDFAAAARVFEGRSRTVIDDRVDYGEVRQITYGWMEQVAVAVVWTERDGACRVISTRRMHRWEIRYVGLD